MAFGKGITDLLGTYSNCISLLKAFRHRREESGDGNAEDKQDRLRKSLRSDRALVERAYSLRVSQSGNRFKKGDDRAISAVDRILESLKNAIKNLLRVSGRSQSPDIDYDSLLSLSNASRVDAIKAIDSLSRRLNTPSRSSLASTSSKASSKKSSSSSSRHKKRSKSEGSRPPLKSIECGGGSPPKQLQSSKKEVSPSAALVTPPPKKLSTSKNSTAPAPTLSATHSPPPPTPPPKPSELHLSPQYHLPIHLRQMSSSPKPGTGNRISMMSFSSDSTKLGEIPQRKWRSVYMSTTEDATCESDEYNVKPTFPLKPYTVEVKERRFWGGLFGRKRETSS
ncbi:hypothetical protein QBC38DRAFT_358599 [Podospora fimiseda]|uniref:Uncharacterized protein n=1 Tax=Podospora fimiseda TaxID=252190 RepID=A0AAN7BVM0_9PEZI|nr:hypothetical protein QBC38DRAFT_358599 [Podospora fimiseda]